MKTPKILSSRSALLCAAGVLLVAGVEAQTRIRTKAAVDLLTYQVTPGIAAATGGGPVTGTTGGSGGVINGPKPTALSPIDVVPAPPSPVP